MNSRPSLTRQTPRREGLGLVTLRITSCSSGMQLSRDVIASAHHVLHKLYAKRVNRNGANDRPSLKSRSSHELLSRMWRGCRKRQEEQASFI
jgi:DNA primase